jgi:short-subunit dehydrogenase
MELIIINDGLLQLIPVTKQMVKGIELVQDINCFQLCDIMRIKLTEYAENLNLHIMNDGSGNFMGCICK